MYSSEEEEDNVDLCTTWKRRCNNGSGLKLSEPTAECVLAKYGLDEALLIRIRRKLFQALMLEDYTLYEVHCDRPHPDPWTMLGGTLFKVKYNRDPISPLLTKDLKYVPNELQNCILSTLNVSKPVT